MRWFSIPIITVFYILAIAAVCCVAPVTSMLSSGDIASDGVHHHNDTNSTDMAAVDQHVMNDQPHALDVNVTMPVNDTNTKMSHVARRSVEETNINPDNSTTNSTINESSNMESHRVRRSVEETTMKPDNSTLLISTNDSSTTEIHRSRRSVEETMKPDNSTLNSTIENSNNTMESHRARRSVEEIMKPDNTTKLSTNESSSMMESHRARRSAEEETTEESGPDDDDTTNQYNDTSTTDDAVHVDRMSVSDMTTTVMDDLNSTVTTSTAAPRLGRDVYSGREHAHPPFYVQKPEHYHPVYRRSIETTTADNADNTTLTTPASPTVNRVRRSDYQPSTPSAYSNDYKGEGVYKSTGDYKPSYGSDYYQYYVIDVNDKNGGSYDIGSSYWNVDCNGNSYSYKSGWIVGIWDDYEDFKDLDKIKCAGSKSKSGGSADYNKPTGPYDQHKPDYNSAGSSSYSPPASSSDYYEYKLNFYDQKKIDLYGSYASDCYSGYLLTALYDEQPGFKYPKYGKCAKLEKGSADSSYCENVYTSYKQGGPYDENTKWNVQCQIGWAAVGIKFEEHQIKYLRCCKLVPGAYESNGYSKPGYGSGTGYSTAYTTPGYTTPPSYTTSPSYNPPGY